MTPEVTNLQNRWMNELEKDENDWEDIAQLFEDMLAALRAGSDRADKAAEVEREACAKEAVRASRYRPECDRVIFDYPNGKPECSLESRGKDCLCMERVEAAEKIAAAIRARTTEKDEA